MQCQEPAPGSFKTSARNRKKIWLISMPALNVHLETNIDAIRSLAPPWPEVLPPPRLLPLRSPLSSRSASVVFLVKLILTRLVVSSLLGKLLTIASFLHFLVVIDELIGWVLLSRFFAAFALDSALSVGGCRWFFFFFFFFKSRLVLCFNWSTHPQHLKTKKKSTQIIETIFSSNQSAVTTAL